MVAAPPHCFSARFPAMTALFASLVIAAQVVGKHLTAVLRVVAIDAEVLPVATVGRVVVMIPIPVVYREKVKVRSFELARAAGTDPAMHCEGAFTVAETSSPSGLFRLPDQRLQRALALRLPASGGSKGSRRHHSSPLAVLCIRVTPRSLAGSGPRTVCTRFGIASPLLRRSRTQLERSEQRVCRFLRTADACNARAWRTRAAPVGQLANLHVRAVGNELDLAVFGVANPARQAEAPRLPHRGVPEPDTLNTSADSDSNPHPG